MARLTAKSRKAIPTKDFAGPDRSYPIENESHARAALSMVAAHGSAHEKALVRSHVKARYPGIEVSGK